MVGRFWPLAPLCLVFDVAFVELLGVGVPVGATGACAVGAGCLAMG